MVKRIATILGIALAAMLVLNMYQRNAANERELELQVKHNEQVLALQAKQRAASQMAALRIDSLKTALQKERQRIARVNARADSLQAQLQEQEAQLPELVPAECNPWVEVLNTCKQALAVKDSVVRDLTIAVEHATEYSDSLGILLVAAHTREDSLAHNLRLTNEAIDKSRCTIIFGVSCPSRTVSAIGASALTLILVGVLN